MQSTASYGNFYNTFICGPRVQTRPGGRAVAPVRREEVSAVRKDNPERLVVRGVVGIVARGGRAAGVVSGDGDQVVVLLFLTQTTTAKGDRSSVSGSRVEVTLKRTGDDWKIAGPQPV